MNKKLILILFIAAVLRFVGIYPGHDAYHSDESIIYGSALEMVLNNTLDPGRYDYPPVPMYINYFLYRTLFIPLSWFKFYIERIPQVLDGLVQINMAPLEARRTLYTFIIGNRGINAMYWARITTATFSLGCVLLIYLLGKNLFNKKIGLLAAFLLAFNFRHVLNSHISLPDVYNSFFLLLAFIFLEKLWRNPKKLNYLLSGIALGVFFSTKYQVFPLISLMMVHCIVNIKNIKSLLIAGITFLITIVSLNPFFFINLEQARYWLIGVSSKYGFGIFRLNLYPISYLYHFDWGPIVSIIFLLGLTLGIKKYFRQMLILLSTVLPFFFVFFFYSRGGFYTRNFITITPFVLLIVAIAISVLTEKLPKIILILTLISSVLIPGKNAIISSRFYTKEWNYRVLSSWLWKNMTPEMTVASHPFDPPTGAPAFKRTEFEISGSYSMAEHLENGAQYGIINTGWAGNPFYGWMGGLAWNKPVEQMRNTFHGLAIEEQLNYRVFVVSKPWQSPDNGLIVVKFPIWPKVEFRTIDNKSKIKGGHLYKITGDLKSSRLLGERERDGFIRARFSPSNWNAVSSRVWGNTNWNKKTIITRAPDTATDLAITLQIENIASGVSYEIKNIKIEESIDKVEDLTLSSPYIKDEIYSDLLYPNSHGNL